MAELGQDEEERGEEEEARSRGRGRAGGDLVRVRVRVRVRVGVRLRLRLRLRLRAPAPPLPSPLPIARTAAPPAARRTVRVDDLLRGRPPHARPLQVSEGVRGQPGAHARLPAPALSDGLGHQRDR